MSHCAMQILITNFQVFHFDSTFSGCSFTVVRAMHGHFLHETLWPETIFILDLFMQLLLAGGPLLLQMKDKFDV